MQLKNFATVSFGVLLSLKAMAYDKEVYRAEMTRVESNKKTLDDEHSRYKICTDYRVDDFFAFDAAAIGPASETSAIFGSKIAPCKLQSLVDSPLSDAYVFSASLELMPALPGTFHLAEEPSIP
ncbi:hypothetical protein [Pseudomonas arsenicoxydans]|uniref:Uncharacterized protein n=1 Tax=Pseudomonas arsenicoxydans TaxID=702115 RepID=A0A502I1P5_9PSED|nr:hypothetical protein [Pseudomonas arsenicoxydans]TPG79562.1 hypothetical protein EAH78_06945 [Pseudomonas arsenicoxydans]